MKKMENKAFKIAGIRNLLNTNYKIPSDLIDVNSLVDNSLSMSENWYNNVKPKVDLLKNERY